MKNRILIFLAMLLTVIVVGSGATMLHLYLQETQSPVAEVDFRKFETMTAQPSDPDAGLELADLEWEETAAETDYGIEETQTEAMEQRSEDSVGSSAHETEDPRQSHVVMDKETYYKRLQDMENIYNSQLKEVQKKSVTAQQEVMTALLETWDDELNAIYQKLRASLSQEDFYQLRDEERAWIRSRDEAARNAAAKDNYGYSTQNLAYTRSLLEWTKVRVYELFEMYYGEE